MVTIGITFQLELELGGMRGSEECANRFSLLAKIGCRITQNPSCLITRVITENYCQSEPFLECKPSSTASHEWRSILIGTNLLAKLLGWMIGFGISINVYYDPWMSHNA